MKMGFQRRGKGIEALVKLEPKLRNAHTIAAYVGAAKLLREAQERCPEKSGNLAWDTSGIYPQSPSNEKMIYFGATYALKIHEGLGWKNLGEKSLEKQSTYGKPVGPKFLTRAMKECASEIAELIARIYKNVKIK